MSDYSFKSFNELSEKFGKLKRKNKLHPIVEKRLASLLQDIYPNAYPITEPGEMPGGRDDLAFYFSDGRYVIFEIFATINQVAQDLRHLEQSNAQARIAILVDPALDGGRIFEEYYRKKPRNPFPQIKLGDILVTENETSVRKQLKEHIEKEFASISRSSKHQELVVQEIHRKRDALRDFLTNDVQIIGMAVTGVWYYNLNTLSIPSLARQLDKAINQVNTIKMMFIADKEIRKIVSGIGHLARLAWDCRISKAEIDLFIKYKKNLEDTLETLEKKLT